MKKVVVLSLSHLFSNNFKKLSDINNVFISPKEIIPFIDATLSQGSILYFTVFCFSFLVWDEDLMYFHMVLLLGQYTMED